MARRFRLILALFALPACQQGNITELVGPAAYSTELPTGVASALAAADPLEGEEGLLARDYGYAAPVIYAFGESLHRQTTRAGQVVYRAERWDSVGLGLVYTSHDSAVWDVDGNLLYRHGGDGAVWGLSHTRGWDQVLPIDGETRMSRSLDVLFGALRIREDEHRRRAVHLFGIQVWRGR